MLIWPTVMGSGYVSGSCAETEPERVERMTATKPMAVRDWTILRFG